MLPYVFQYYMCFYNSLADDVFKTFKLTDSMLNSPCSEFARNYAKKKPLIIP